jgi:hypothetical protein
MFAFSFNLHHYTEASLGGEEGAAAADATQRKFWSRLGELCKPWGGIALAHSPGLDSAVRNIGEDVAAMMIEMTGVEVVRPGRHCPPRHPHPLDPRLIGELESHDVGLADVAHHVIVRIYTLACRGTRNHIITSSSTFGPSVLESDGISRCGESIICQAHCPQRHAPHLDPNLSS